MSDAPSYGTPVEDATSLVCETCRNSIFSSDGWRAVLAAGNGEDGHKQPGTAKSKGYTYSASGESIRAGAAAGCNWCNTFKGISGRDPHPNQIVTITTAHNKHSDCTPAGTRELSVSASGTQGGYMTATTYLLYTDSDNPAARFIAARDRILDLAAESSYQLALDCIKTCANGHEDCPEPSPSTLPDRVLDCSNPENPRLVLTGGEICGTYATLSYVWGGSQPMTTTKNIKNFVESGLDITQFPATIREAVLVANRLGIRYLWIDALCIIQDSPDDKMRQIAVMRRIYRNCYVTIIVACADSVHEGFLHRERPRKVPTARIPFPCPDGKVGSVWLAKTMDTDINDGSRSYWDELEPANYRGWCLQERLLSPRCLIYAKHTLQYYCNTETVNIGHALCEPSTGVRLPSVVQWPQTEQTELSPQQMILARQSWLSVVFIYTLREISYSGDKLLAIAGVAEQFYYAFKTRYLAGLWESTLLEDLLWHKESAGGVESPPPSGKSYRAPSWSWAAVDGLVAAPNHGSKFEPGAYNLGLCEIVSCEVTLVSADSLFGAVLAAKLILKGPVCSATCRIQKIGETSTDLLVRVDDGPEQATVGWVRWDSPDEDTARTCLKLIPLMWDKGDNASFVEGIVVSPVDEQNYRRVGHFQNKYGSKDWRRIVKALVYVIQII